MPNDAIAEQVEVRRKGRQRLIGAIVLALLAVVFVPMLLDPEPRRDRAEPLLAIPPKEGAAPLAAVTRAPEQAQGAKEEAAKPEAAKPEAAKPEAAKPEAAKPEAAIPGPAPVAAAPKPEAKVLAPAAPPPRAATAARPEPRPAAAPKLEGFAVQVGAFREEAKLAQAREKVVAARIPHYTERLDSASGELTRLRAGPFPTREAADKAAAQLKRAGLDVRVVPLP